MSGKDRLLWYYEVLNDEGRETLERIARSFAATGTYARLPDMTEELRECYDKLNRAIDARMEDDF